ncbi:hypothetical protein EGR_10495 [Echinococcus granulosus]|uniref:Uncharacterized protein n=1 Tax=Echinococcus granulosus TaxID=6210 RepID=W6U0S9_ECHGR|nr:hypothetical protein EGR_10495 [Echinococcus granulosus]EUB54643.1 hypothetical protein EGR_10495 [Echinococcus granulosus]
MQKRFHLSHLKTHIKKGTLFFKNDKYCQVLCIMKGQEILAKRKEYEIRLHTSSKICYVSFNIHYKFGQAHLLSFVSVSHVLYFRLMHIINKNFVCMARNFSSSIPTVPLSNTAEVQMLPFTTHLRRVGDICRIRFKNLTQICLHISPSYSSLIAPVSFSFYRLVHHTWINGCDT